MVSADDLVIAPGAAGLVSSAVYLDIAVGGHGDLLLRQVADTDKIPCILVEPAQLIAGAAEILQIGGEQGVIPVIEAHLHRVHRGAGRSGQSDRQKHT